MDTAMSEDSLFSRERAAGYDPTVLENAVVALVGCGAAGNNIAQSLSLLGAGELRFIDPDVVEKSNLPRSPLFNVGRAEGKRRRHKASECAHGALAISHARAPVVCFAVSRIEELGYGAFMDASVIVAAADAFPVRAWLSDAARLLGIPLVELGFSGHRGHVSAWAYRGEEAACWRCAHPRVEHGGVGCSLYARGVSALGMVPATQPLAGVFGNLAAAHVAELIHGRHALDGKIVHFDILSGQSRVVEVTVDPSCPGVHRGYGEVRPVPVGPDQMVSELMNALGGFCKEPLVHLRAVYVKSAPCRLCGATVEIGRPEWAVSSAPECRACPEVPQFGGAGLDVVSTIEPDDELSELRLAELGVGAADVLEVADRASGSRFAVRLKGSIDDLFTTLTKDARNGARGSSKKPVGATDAPTKEHKSGE